MAAEAPVKTGVTERSTVESCAYNGTNHACSTPYRTIASFLQPYTTDFETLDKDYHIHAQNSMVRTLIGVVPNSTTLFHLSPSAFRTHNVLIPAFFNLPFALWESAVPLRLIALTTYTCSTSVQCNYCVAHTCTMALRRGADESLLTGNRQLTSKEAVVVDIAKVLSLSAGSVTREDREKLYAIFTKQQAEHVVLGAAMMGWLNTFMDATGLDLEEACVMESKKVLQATGWSSGKHDVAKPAHWMQQEEKGFLSKFSWIANLGLLRHAPAALSYESMMYEGVPKNWPLLGEYLAEKVGYDFPYLKVLVNERAVRALTTVLVQCLADKDNEIRKEVKLLAGIVHGVLNGNCAVEEDFYGALQAACPQVEEDVTRAVRKFAQEDTPFEAHVEVSELKAALPDFSENEVYVLYTLKACSTLPTRTSPKVVALVQENFSPRKTVELITWASTLQAIHRIYGFYGLDISANGANGGS